MHSTENAVAGGKEQCPCKLREGRQRRVQHVCCAFLVFFVALSAFLAVCLTRCPQESSDICPGEKLATWCKAFRGRRVSIYSLHTPAPAQDVVSWKHIWFTRATGDGVSPYQGPSTPERDQLWDDLYNRAWSIVVHSRLYSYRETDGINRIPGALASKLVDKSVPIPGDPEHYIVTLTVFHDLHCLVRHPLSFNVKVDNDNFPGGPTRICSASAFGTKAILPILRTTSVLSTFLTASIHFASLSCVHRTLRQSLGFGSRKRTAQLLCSKYRGRAKTLNRFVNGHCSTS